MQHTLAPIPNKFIQDYRQFQVKLDNIDTDLGNYQIVDNNIVSITTDDTTVWTPHATEYLEDGTTALTTQFATIQAGIQMNSTANYKFRGTATSAEYADLAERYAADQEYDPGTVIRIDRGDAEITQTTEEADINVFGIISTAPGFEMNAGAGTDATHPFVALSGRVPCKVVGTIHKGDRLVTSSIPGTARIANPTELADYRNIIGRAMETKTTEEVSLIEVVVGAK